MVFCFVTICCVVKVIEVNCIADKRASEDIGFDGGGICPNYTNFDIFLACIKMKKFWYIPAFMTVNSSQKYQQNSVFNETLILLVNLLSVAT